VGRLVDIGDTQLFVEERGDGPVVVVLHGGPGADHTQLKDYLDPLTDEFRLMLIDQRAQGPSGPARRETWTFEQNARDIAALTQRTNARPYAVLGHSYGAMVTLVYAVLSPGSAKAHVVSHGVPSGRWYRLEEELAHLEPAGVRLSVGKAWRELESVADPGRMAELVAQQMPFHFKDPLDPRVEDMNRRMAAEMIHTPEVNRAMSERESAAFDVEDQLAEIRDPMLIIGGRHDRVCPPEASEFMAKRIRDAELVIFANSGHVSYAEENDAYVKTVRGFLRRHLR